MLVLRVTMGAGRSPGQKAALMERLSEAAARHLDVPLDQVRLVIHEVSPEHWGIGGKSLAVHQRRQEHRAP